MGLLASLLPGLRDLRTPFAVGSLWLAAIVTWVYPRWDSIDDNAGVAQLAGLTSDLPPSVRLAAAAFGAYVLGIVVNALTTALGRRVRSWGWTAVLQQLAMKVKFRRGRMAVWKLARFMMPTTDRTHELFVSAMRARLDQHLPGISDVIPPGSLWEQEDLAAFRLAKEAPEQFATYDRTRSEAEFRAGVVLPLLALAASIAWLTGWWWLMVAVVIAVRTLLLQAVALDRTAKQLLITSLALGYTSMPFLDEIEAVLSRGDDLDAKVQGVVRLYLEEPGAGYLHYLVDDALRVLGCRNIIWEMRRELPDPLREELEAGAASAVRGGS